MALYDYGGYVYFEHSAGTTKKQLSRQIWDTVLHERTRDKIFFKNFIGEDRGGEGDVWNVRTFAPIVEKNDFTKQAGDLMTIPIIQHINVDPLTAGVVGNEVLIGREKNFTFGHQKITIDLFREAVGVVGGMNLKRNPLDLMNIAINQLSDYASVYWDLEIFNAIYAGWSYNLLRSLGGVYFSTDSDGFFTSLLPTHPNTFWGEVGNTEPQNLTTSHTFNTTLIDNLKIWVEENNIVPVMIEGEPTWILIIHPRQEKQLRSDPNWRQAVLYAKERTATWEHPLFKKTDYWWAGFAIFVTQKIRPAYYYGLKTIGANKYGLKRQNTTVNGYNYAILNSTAMPVPSGSSSGMLPTGITYNQVRGAVLLGGNSVVIANGSQWHSERRKEDDYGFFYGFALWKIYGMKRSDWYDTIDASGGNLFNQSSAVIYTYSP
ncbi:MAG: DUF4043 family protein [Candidatus Aenigmatarchaeota archaeon]